MAISSVAFLGPRGTYAEKVTQRRFAAERETVPCPTIAEVFHRVADRSSELGVVPIENNSGGIIYETVDELVLPSYDSPVKIRESLAMDVQLALLSRSRMEDIRVVYSHFVPLKHCQDWLQEHLPQARPVAVSSTGNAAIKAAAEEGTAAIADPSQAERRSLNVLQFPVANDKVNTTRFLLIGGDGPPAEAGESEPYQSTIVFRLVNDPGALVDFLLPLRDNDVNMTRIISRPIPATPGEYIFLVDVRGRLSDPNVAAALERAGAKCLELNDLGSYPVRPPYSSV